MATKLPKHLAHFYAAIDAMDAKTYGAAFANDAVVTFGSFPPVVGQETIQANFKTFNDANLQAMRHEFLEVFEQQGDVFALESVVHYVLKNGANVRAPCVTVLRYRSGLIADMHIYMDTGPLLAAMSG